MGSYRTALEEKAAALAELRKSIVRRKGLYREGITSQRAPFHHGGHHMRISTTPANEAAFVNHVTILYWTKFFGMTNVFEQDITCPHDNLTVRISHDRKLLPNASALIFHGRGFSEDDLPERMPDQKWIFDSQESPFHDIADGMSWITDFKVMRQFDYSMSYHTEADFFHPMWVYDDYTELVLTDPKYSFEEKSGHIMYLASNCESHNDRESYVAALMRHTSVQSYGTCMHNMNGTSITGAHRRSNQCASTQSIP